MNHSLALISIIICLLLGCCTQRQTKKNTSHIPNSIFVESDTSDTPEVEEDSLEVYRFRFDKPVKGYTVTVEVTMSEPGLQDYAVISFSKGNLAFSVFLDYFDKNSFNIDDYTDKSREYVLHYTPKPKGTMLYEDEPFCFSDVDFDGTEELIVLDPGGGPHGVNAFLVYECDGTLREDAPFSEINIYTHFNAADKTITQIYYDDPETGPLQNVYKRQKDGSFALIKEDVPVSSRDDVK